MVTEEGDPAETVSVRFGEDQQDLKIKIIKLIDRQILALINLRSFQQMKEKNSIDNRPEEELKASQIHQADKEFSFEFKHPLHEVVSNFKYDLFAEDYQQSKEIINKSLSLGDFELFSFDLIGKKIT